MSLRISRRPLALLGALALSAGIAAIGTALAADDGHARLKADLESKLNIKVDSITKSGYLGLYEVYADGTIFYTDEKGSAYVFGNLVDAKTRQSVTEARMAKLNAIKFADLPLDSAVKQVKGNGSRTLVTFEDPNCGYCKRLAKDLQKLDNVTIYTFLYPILSQDSVDKAKQIWCSADKVKAWNDLMLDGRAPSGKGDCTTPTQKVVELGQKYNIRGTPTLVFTDGERIPGAVPLDRIEKKLASLGK